MSSAIQISNEAGRPVEYLVQDVVHAVPDPRVRDQLRPGQLSNSLPEQWQASEGIGVATEEDGWTADVPKMRRPFLPRLRLPRRMERKAEEHQAGTGCVSRQEGSHPTTEGVTT